MFKILVIEDNKDLCHTMCAHLNRNGYESKGAHDANEAFDSMINCFFDLIISDIMLPKTDGYEIAKIIRATNPEIPILFVSAKDDFTSKQKGFLAGIDDYMVKPIDLDEMLLRISAILRRSKINNSRKLVIGSFSMNMDERSARLDDVDVPLTAKEFNILYKLLSYPKKTFTRSQLMEEFWDTETTSGQRTVDVFIARLRERFSDCKDFEIITVHGLGYKAVLK